MILLSSIKKYGCVVLVLHVPFLLIVKATFNPINPFSGIYTGISLPIIAAIANAPAINKNDLLLLVLSTPMLYLLSFSLLTIGAYGVPLNNSISLLL